MRASGMRSALIAASVVSLVTGGCVTTPATSASRGPVATSAPAGAASPGSAGYSVGEGLLDAVAATSAADAWAVGNLSQKGAPLIVHWNGSTWSRVPAGVPASTQLVAVAASSPGNAWALGEVYRGEGARQPVTVHWDGRAWRQAPLSAPLGTFLSGVSVTSPASAWAVGSYWTTAEQVASRTRPVALHWDGSAWRRVPLPALPLPAGGGAELSGVSATSASNAWAAGAFLSDVGDPGAGFVLHWDGSSWSRVPSAPASAGNPIAVVATAPDYAWLLGTVTGLWNGHDWTTVPLQWVKKLADGRGGEVLALAVSGHNAWVAGDYCTNPGGGCMQQLPLLLRWTGDAWKLTPPPTDNVFINGLAVTSATNAWAVGYEFPHATLILHWNGSKWS